MIIIYNIYHYEMPKSSNSSMNTVYYNPEAAGSEGIWFYEEDPSNYINDDSDDDYYDDIFGDDGDFVQYNNYDDYDDESDYEVEDVKTE